jgi:hypothetical protein
MGISNTIPPSRLIQPGVVANTAARPTSPFTGQAIYQVDTNQYLIWNGTAWVIPNKNNQNNDGFDLVTPTSVAGTGVTVSGSLVTFSAATTVRLNGVFSSAYTNYRIVFDTSTNVGGGEIRIVYYSGGSALTAGYTSAGLYMGLSGGTQSNTNIGTGRQGIAYGMAGFFDVASAAGGGTLDVFNPFAAGATTANFACSSYSTNSGFQTSNGGHIHYAAGSADGFQIYTSGTSWTGTIRVYGYRN